MIISMIKWNDGILNSLDTPYTNRFIEICNNKIKVLEHNDYLYINFKIFRNIILHIFVYKKEEKSYIN